MLYPTPDLIESATCYFTVKTKLLDSPTLRQWTAVHAGRNLLWLFLDYVTAAVIITLTVYFWHNREAWGLHFATSVIVGIVAVILVGCTQHRIGLMGHEASHYLLHPDRKTNDILAELLCFFPVFGTLSQYRAKHLSHHLHPNDPERDMNMRGSRARKLYSHFPMPKPSFIYNYYIKFFWPPFVIYNLVDLLRVVTIGSGLSPIPKDEKNPAEKNPFYKNATIWGIAYMAIFVGIVQLSRERELSFFFISLASTYLLGLVVTMRLPETWFTRPGGKLSHSFRFAGVLRLTFVTALLLSLGLSFRLTGVWTAGYFLLLWILPLIYVFPYLMLLREIYQHANADQGDLTNSRVMFTDPFTKWALLGYGNDAHLIHHIYPNIPQYHLLEVHEKLLESNSNYREVAEETYGVYSTSGEDHHSLLDSLSAQPRSPVSDS